MALKRRSVGTGTSKNGSGLGMVDRAVKRSEEKRAAGQAKFVRFEDGDTKVLRVLVDTWEDRYVHRVPMVGQKGKRYFKDIACLDQQEKGIPCEGCKEEHPRRYKFWVNAIVRDEPVLDSEGKDTGKKKDQLMILAGGVKLARALNKKHGRFGLHNRDIEIEREGEDRDTEYNVEWADDENTALSANDKKLAEKLYDLSRYTKIPDNENFYGDNERDDDDDDDRGQRSVRRGSAFSRTKNSREDGEDAKTTKSTARRKTGLAAVAAKKAGQSSGAKKTVVRRRTR